MKSLVEEKRRAVAQFFLKSQSLTIENVKDGLVALYGSAIKNQDIVKIRNSVFEQLGVLPPGPGLRRNTTTPKVYIHPRIDQENATYLRRRAFQTNTTAGALVNDLITAARMKKVARRAKR